MDRYSVFGQSWYSYFTDGIVVPAPVTLALNLIKFFIGLINMAVITFTLIGGAACVVGIILPPPFVLWGCYNNFCLCKRHMGGVIPPLHTSFRK